MRIVILGSAAGGGVPQWNCRCPVCDLAWRGDPRVQPRSQTSVAVSADGERWLLIDAAPELRHQILATSVLQPSGQTRHSPIADVLLTSGDVDHLAGLLCLRERQTFTLHATRDVLDEVAASRIFDVLAPDFVQRSAMTIERGYDMGGLDVRLFAVPGKVPLYRESDAVAIGSDTGAVVGVEIGAGGRRLCYVPSVAYLTPDLVERLGSADVLLLDGTTFHDDELPSLGVSPKTAGRMGHLAMSGPRGSLALLAGAPARRISIHINNTNPVLIAGSPEQQAVQAAGWELAYDGMEIAL